MSRLLKILVYAVVLFFIFLWMSTVYKSCNDSENNKTTSATSETVIEDNYSADDFFEEGSEENNSGNDAIDYTEIDKVVEEKINESNPAPTRDIAPDEIVSSTQSSSESTSVNKGNENGKYMVIAGSYLIKENAERMRKRIQDLGYEQSSLVVFDLSQYHSVVAARFSDYDKALKVSNELKRRGVDCYVHAQQY